MGVKGQRGGGVPGLELHRKLPDYEEMKRLYLDGMSYRQMAVKFDCNPGAVLQTMKNRATRRGEWPLPKVDVSERIRKRQIERFQDRRIDSTRLRNWFLLRLELSGEEVKPFATRHHIAPELLFKLKRGDLPDIDRDWAAKLEAALVQDARAAEEK